MASIDFVHGTLARCTFCPLHTLSFAHFIRCIFYSLHILPFIILLSFILSFIIFIRSLVLLLLLHLLLFFGTLSSPTHPCLRAGV
ncbi:hypothetical protein BKA91DRAFT_142535 [Yarrowia lipolytica]|nr:hypothetical protein BKA91DRAFT_142535 [Yarrowia lipolytica]KAE8169657.1 hypothetical protein BKA90DRAFT_142196 [Yarrowia lipolytica]RMI97250.1 hypothetical protein BD777DRAFT_126947 [Yarrowia lipolytica]